MRLIFSLIFLFVWGLPGAASAQVMLPDVDASPEIAVNYRIHQGDKLSVKFLYHQELDVLSLTVRPDGFISLQMIDELKVEGLTVAELKQRLKKAYEEILIEPIISVTVLEFVAPRIYIGGQINKPGVYNLRDAQTLVQVIFLAGGFTRDANTKMVVHARPDGKGNWQFQSANITKMLNKKGTENDLLLRDGDYIFIPESKISQLNKAIEGIRGFLPRFF
jgi:protein involved in polysaccharide export with SLBB domain